MIINKLPGVYYNEDMTYELTGAGSKIPVFIGVSNNKDYYKFVSYDSTGKTKYGTGIVVLTGEVKGDKSEVEVLSNSPEPSDNPFIGKKFYVETNAKPDGETLYSLYGSDGTTDANIKVSISVHHKTDGTQIHTYENYNEINKPITEGGLGTEFTVTKDNDNNDIITSNLGTNKLLNRIKEFYEEAKLITSGDIGVPYIYVIDIGDGKNINQWLNGLETAKRLHDATVEIYIGAYLKTEGDVTTVNITENDLLTTFLEKVYYGKSYNGSADSEDDFGLKDCATNLDLRYAFTSIELEDNTQRIDNILISITNNFRHSRIGLCEPLLFGKTMARICCTPNNTEPGYFVYRSVNPDTFHARTKHDMLELQNKGIIFNSDEHINGNVYPKMNLCVATSFANGTARPADALFHARFNADDLLREVFEACYTQVKNNESATNIAYLQTRINKIVNDRVVAEEMIKYNDKEETGTKLYVSESDSNPYNLIVHGQIQPVKCTIAIDVRATIKI